MTFREYMLLKLGVDTTAISAGLDRLSGMLGTWAGGIANNLTRRVRAYVERFIAIIGVHKMIDAIRDSMERLNNAFAESSSLAERLRSSLNVAMQFKLLSGEISNATDALLKWYEELQKGDGATKDFVTAMREQFGRMTDMQIQLELLRKGGKLIAPQEIQQLRTFLDSLAAAEKGGPTPSAISVLAQAAWTAFRPWRKEQSVTEMTSVLAASQWFDNLFKRARMMFMPQVVSQEEAANLKKSLPELFGTVFQHLTVTQTPQKFMQLLQEEANRKRMRERLENEIKIIDVLQERLKAEEDYSKQLKAIADKYAKTKQLIELSPEEKRFDLQIELMKLETEEIELRKDMARKRQEMMEKMRREEERYNEAVSDINRRMADLQDQLEGVEQQRMSRRQRFFPGVEDVAGDPFSPFRRVAMAQRFFERAARVLRGRGFIAGAEFAEQRALQLEDMLRRAGIILQDDGIQKLNRNAERIQRAIDALVEDARRKGIKIQPQLSD